MGPKMGHFGVPTPRDGGRDPSGSFGTCLGIGMGWDPIPVVINGLPSHIHNTVPSGARSTIGEDTSHVQYAAIQTTWYTTSNDM